MIDTLQKLYGVLGNPDLQAGDNIVDMAVDAIKQVQDLKSGLKIVETRNRELHDQIVELHDALGDPGADSASKVIELAVEAIDERNDLRDKYRELQDAFDLSGTTVDRARRMLQQLRASNEAKDRLLDTSTQVGEVLRDSNDTLRNDLEVADETASELREYSNHCLDIIETQRKVLKIIARVSCDETVVRRGTVAQLVDNTLSGYYDD